MNDCAITKMRQLPRKVLNTNTFGKFIKLIDMFYLQQVGHCILWCVVATAPREEMKGEEKGKKRERKHRGYLIKNSNSGLSESSAPNPHAEPRSGQFHCGRTGSSVKHPASAVSTATDKTRPPPPEKVDDIRMNTETLTKANPMRFIGSAILIGGALLLGREIWLAAVFHDPRVADAMMWGVLAAGATAAGSLPVVFSRRLSSRIMDSLLGFGAGVMLAATAFSLIMPGLEAAQDLGASRWKAGFIIAAGILAGGALLMMIDKLLPHEHFIKGPEGIVAQRLRRTWLFVFAICLHNLPEGLAIGVAFGGSDQVGASTLATGIAIQDIPEGLVVAVALVTVGYSRVTALLIGCASGLVEPIGSVLGASVVTTSALLLPWGLAFAGGAMLFVISHEIIPESHRKGHEHFATSGLMLGFVIMMILDTVLQ